MREAGRYGDAYPEDEEAARYVASQDKHQAQDDADARRPGRGRGIAGQARQRQEHAVEARLGHQARFAPDRRDPPARLDDIPGEQGPAQEQEQPVDGQVLAERGLGFDGIDAVIEQLVALQVRRKGQ